MGVSSSEFPHICAFVIHTTQAQHRRKSSECSRLFVSFCEQLSKKRKVLSAGNLLFVRILLRKAGM